MENFLLSFRVVFPLFFMLALGYALRRLEVASEQVFDGCTTLVFRVFLPLHLFLDICGTSPEQAFEPVLMLAVLGGTLVFWLGCMLLIPRAEPENAKRAAMVQGCFRNNFVLFGIPVAKALCGAPAAGYAAMVIAITVPMYNILAVVTLEFFRGGRPDPKAILKGIVTNPLIIAAAAGLLWMAAGLQMPALLGDTLADIAGISTPLAIIALGGTFRFSAVGGNRSRLVLVLIAKLVIQPAILLSASVLLGIRGAMLAVVLTASATPTAISSFPMAQKMGADGELAGQIVVFATIFSILSMFLWIFLFTSLGLI